MYLVSFSYFCIFELIFFSCFNSPPLDSQKAAFDVCQEDAGMEHVNHLFNFTCHMCSATSSKEGCWYGMCEQFVVDVLWCALI